MGGILAKTASVKSEIAFSVPHIGKECLLHRLSTGGSIAELYHHSNRMCCYVLGNTPTVV